jgi:S1-C subfamily serine protease
VKALGGSCRTTPVDASHPIHRRSNQAIETGVRALGRDPLCTVPDTASANRQRITSIQRRLASIGYDPGPADGILGPKSRAAIRAFQAREGLPVNGVASDSLLAAPRSATGAVASAAPAAPRPTKKTSTGSGFYVSAQGHVLTNEHVAGKCRQIRIPNIGMADRIAVDKRIDLALLKAAGERHHAASFRGGRGVRTGEDIIVPGYPLQSVLASEMNVTKGIVSALAGPGNDRRIIQITAPVQPGNSGGPVLDMAGNVVGVVVAKLNSIKIAKATGSLPANVNLAISEGAARAFLDAYDVPYETARSGKKMEPADIAARAKRYTVLVECWK